ncbi:hypothetical protein BC940DRAFT_296900 [Gongronella butleri]|nr:hypothetical protein BC940DRAFT_296900 [Gongronella butleri]
MGSGIVGILRGPENPRGGGHALGDALLHRNPIRVPCSGSFISTNQAAKSCKSRQNVLLSLFPPHPPGLRSLVPHLPVSAPNFPSVCRPQDPAAASLSVSHDAMGLRNAEFLRRDDSSVHWRCKTLADMDKATTSNNSKNESQPIKARLKKMADQRQMSRRQMLREKADQACLETLYLHSLEPPLAALNN